MTAQYWNFVEVGTNGKCRIREIEVARNFLLEQFPELANLSEISKRERERNSKLSDRKMANLLPR